MSVGSGIGAHVASGGRSSRPRAWMSLGSLPTCWGSLSCWQAACLSKQQIWSRAGSSFSAEGSLQPCSSATASSCWCEFQARVAVMTPLRKPVPLACYRQAVNAYSVSAYLLAVKELFSCSQLPATPDLGVSIL